MNDTERHISSNGARRQVAEDSSLTSCPRGAMVACDRRQPERGGAFAMNDTAGGRVRRTGRASDVLRLPVMGAILQR